VNVAVALGVAFGQPVEPASATSANAINAKTTMQKNARENFIKLSSSSLTLHRGFYRGWNLPT
jgi:hypothetical protein